MSMIAPFQFFLPNSHASRDSRKKSLHLKNFEVASSGLRKTFRDADVFKIWYRPSAESTEPDTTNNLQVNAKMQFPGEGKTVKGLLFRTLTLTICLLLTSVAVKAQVGNASLTGIIKDPSGAVIENAQVTLHSVDEAFVRSAVAGSNGIFVISTLPPGRYQVTVSASGFGTQETQPFNLTSGQTGSLNVTLKIATGSTKVVVSEAPPILQTTSESLESVVSGKTLSSIPLLGRSFLNAMTLAPGVIPVPPTGSTTNFSPVSQSAMPSVYGQRQKDNDFLIDGVPNNDPNLLGVAIYPPPDAIREMTIDSGVGSSAYGHASGATVDLVTKSGTTAWHGDAWEYWRNNILDANSYFLKVGSYHWNQFGGAAGGPLFVPRVLSRKRNWYVYGYYEGVRISQPANYTTLLPTADQLAGNFAGFNPIYNPFDTTGTTGAYTRTQFPGNQIPTTMLNPTSVTLAKALFPAPNLPPGAIPGVNYINTGASLVNSGQWNLRVDHQFGERDSFFARYSEADYEAPGVSLPHITGITTTDVHSVEASDTHVVSKSFVVTVRYGLTRVNFHTGNFYPAGLAASAGIDSVWPAFLGTQTIPSTGISGYVGISGNHSEVIADQHTGIVDAQKIIGEHTVEFGADITHTTTLTGNLTGTSLSFLPTQTSDFTSTTGDAMASFLLGVPDSAARELGGIRADLNTYGYGFYAQDTWRRGPLTVNGGVRYDYNAPPVNSFGLGELDYNTGVYVFDQKNPITGEAANIPPGGVPPDRNNFAPRLGVAYAISPRTVVRASAGVFYDSFGANYIQAPNGPKGDWPFAFPQSVAGLNASTVNAQIPNPFPGNPVGSPTPSSACSQCLNLDKNSSRTPYVEEWTLSLQRQIGSNLTVEGAYFGSKGNKGAAQIIDNTASSPGPAPYSSRQKFPQYSPYILNGYNEFPSWYNGASLRVQRHYSHGLSFMASYTYSKNIDYLDDLNNGGIFGQANSNPTRFNTPLFRGLSGFDIRNVFALSNVWDIPWRTRYRLVNAVAAGWSLSNILTYRSGIPFSVFLGTDNENIGGTCCGRFTEFPNLVGDPNAVHQNPSEWFNTAAFAVPASGTVGNVHRNPPYLKSGSFTDDDLAAGKTWPIHESVSFELRGEFFNLFNHANFAFPGQVIDTAAFGKVSNTLNDGRTVQLVAKIHF
jgi:hypothetical protein